MKARFQTLWTPIDVEKSLTLLEVLGGSVDELQSGELEAALLEAADDVADDATLDAVGLQRWRTVVSNAPQRAGGRQRAP